MTLVVGLGYKSTFEFTLLVVVGLGNNGSIEFICGVVVGPVHRPYRVQAWLRKEVQGNKEGIEFKPGSVNTQLVLCPP